MAMLNQEKVYTLVLCLLLTGVAKSAPVMPKRACEQIAALKLPNVTISAAEISADADLPDSGDPKGVEHGGNPDHCRVLAHVTPTPRSDILVEVWIPTVGWNGRYLGIGNSGFAGQIDYAAMKLGVSQGYAVAATDGGHRGTAVDASWARDQPEKIADFGWRAIHVMTKTAKAIVASFEGTPAKYSYFYGCSSGGRQALMEAQRFPDDYDGILAGAPAADWTGLFAMGAASLKHLDNPSGYIPPTKLQVIGHEVLANCGAQGSAPNGVIPDPTECHFNPASLLCKETKDSVRPSCLSMSQVSTLKALYRGLRGADGRIIFPGYEPGGESGPGGWQTWITGERPHSSLMFVFATAYFSNFLFHGRAWDPQNSDPIALLHLANRMTGKALNATDPNLTEFWKRGGKLIMYHGWSDPAIPPRSTVDYYLTVVRHMSDSRVSSFVRLYMIPGMQHCSGGPGDADFGQLGTAKSSRDPHRSVARALEEWVEAGTAPAGIIGRSAQPDAQGHNESTTRLLCPYPLVASYSGAGNLSDASNFVCAPAR